VGLEWARCLGDDDSSKSYAEQEAVRGVNGQMRMDMMFES
jgi:hypothetical protein